MPRNSQIIKTYQKLAALNKIKPSRSLEKLLRLKKVRSLSGIVSIAVLTKPYPCPGNCIYCPTQSKMPKSYLSDEPAVMRAQMAGFDPSKQVALRLEQLQATGHSTEKIEMIVMGGTFSSLTKKYQENFIKSCFEACNKKKSSSLLKAQKLNEKAKNRIIGLTLETRPDKITKKEIIWMRKLGATRVEIGVQSLYNPVLKKVNRGHQVKETIKATRLLKEAGFKVCYHLMPNLPGSDLKKDLLMFKKVFQDSRFKPDMIKIYPCVVIYDAQLYQWFKKGQYEPYKEEELLKLLKKIKRLVPPWVRIMRLGRDIPVSNIAAGSRLSNIRQVLHQKGVKCRCIRCREIKGKEMGKPNYWQTSYSASGGKDHFLEFHDKKDALYALLRLRINKEKNHFLPELKNSGIIREVHTYGQSLALSKKDKSKVQHQGLGKQLIKKAELITKKAGLKKIAVISGIGARQYYQNLGYQLEGTYMTKKISHS